MNKLACLAVTLIAVALLAAACGGDDNDPAPTRTPDIEPTLTDVGAGPVFTGTMLTISNRSNLSVCVDGGAGNIVTSADVDKVRQAIDDGLAGVRSFYTDAEQYRNGATTSAGCPPPTAALTVKELAERPSTQRHNDLLGDPVRALSQDSLSPNRVFVYVISQVAYERAFGSKPYAFGASEYLCTDHVCAEVTTGLYVPPSVPPEVLSDGILEAIGYLPSASQGDPPGDPVEAERLRQEAEGRQTP